MPRTIVEEDGVVVFDSDQTPEGQVENTITARAVAALDANATFLALGSPTAAQTLAQVQKLTREMNALIRHVLARFDSDTGT